MELRLADGTTITGLSRPPQGMRHRMVFGVEVGSGREVAAKIELIEGALERERRALEWLTECGGPSPRLVAAGRVVGGEYDGVLCLVTEWRAGGLTTTVDGWRRLGRSLARLSEAPWRRGDLPTLDHGDFLALHERQVAELTATLGRNLGEVLPAVPSAYLDSPLILTHGDPGPGNFLDDGAEGTLVDWEDAGVAPRGLDLARAIFMALLGSGPEGFVATEQRARAAAVRAGFITAAREWSPGEDELFWWLGVAGIQSAHWRLEREGRPSVLPWLEAVTVLEAALADPAL